MKMHLNFGKVNKKFHCFEDIKYSSILTRTICKASKSQNLKISKILVELKEKVKKQMHFYVACSYEEK